MQTEFDDTGISWLYSTFNFLDIFLKSSFFKRKHDSYASHVYYTISLKMFLENTLK